MFFQYTYIKWNDKIPYIKNKDDKKQLVVGEQEREMDDFISLDIIYIFAILQKTTFLTGLDYLEKSGQDICKEQV